MKIEELERDSLKGFLADYVIQPDRLNDLFSYMPNDSGWLKERSADLSERSFSHRDDLVNLLERRHASLPANHTCKEQLHKLKKKNSLVVVGGQQAGLLTGPLFTVYKAMSLIMLAKQYEKELGQPVVPLFWIAGEDHDLDEIRFLYANQKGTWKKRMLKDENLGEAATTKELPKKELLSFVAHIFGSLPETMHTAQLKAKVENHARQASTYSEFFCCIMHDLFSEEGLIYVDSGDPELRAIEKPFFKKLILNMDKLQQKQAQGEQRLTEKGYPTPIGTDFENAHLFYTVKQQRRRLDFEDGCFYVRETNLSFTTDELLDELEGHPERFSNNVVTRPLMQEWLLPTAAFVAGPGELAYWGTLKDAFAEFGFKLTPVIPRLSATFVPRHVEKHLSEKAELAASYIAGKGIELRESWLNEQHSYAIEETVLRAAAEIEQAHKPLRELAEEISPTLQVMSEKNKAFIEDQVAFLKDRMEKEIRLRHSTELMKYNESIDWLCPLGQLQERVLNPFVLLNLAGSDIISRMLRETPPLTSRHLVYYL